MYVVVDVVDFLCITALLCVQRGGVGTIHLIHCWPRLHCCQLGKHRPHINSTMLDEMLLSSMLTVFLGGGGCLYFATHFVRAAGFFCFVSRTQ